MLSQNNSKLKSGEILSGQILVEPFYASGQLVRGAAIASAIDELVRRVPSSPDYYYLIERRAWRGLNHSIQAHIKLVEDLSYWRQTAKSFAHAIRLPFGPADFVDMDVFRPSPVKKQIDVLYLASWDSWKRHIMLIETFPILMKALRREPRILIAGHFRQGGTTTELEYQESVRLAAQQFAPYVEVRVSDSNDHLVFRTPEDVATVISSARVGVVCSLIEGINRFKMECLASDVPIAISSAACVPLKKHISRMTGLFANESDPKKGFAEAVASILKRPDRFRPRAYLERRVGMKKCCEYLRRTLQQLVWRNSSIRVVYPAFSWNGRNESLLWEDFEQILASKCAKYGAQTR